MSGPRVQRNALMVAVNLGILAAMFLVGALVIDRLVDLPDWAKWLTSFVVCGWSSHRFTKWHDRQDAIEAVGLEEQR